MTLFWIAAAALAAAACALIIARAARAAAAAASGGAPDPAQEVYERQLAEVDEMAERGLLGEDERRSAFAEAGRRLLATRRQATPAAAASGPGVRRIVVLVSGAAAFAAFAIYMVVGAPGLHDEPFRLRMKAWQHAARTDPQTLNAEQLAAVLEDRSKTDPDNAELIMNLGRARMLAGDAYGAQEAFRRLTRLAPKEAAAWNLLGQSLMATASEGKVSDEAVAAFEQALALDPKNLQARFSLGQIAVAEGDVAKGVAIWTAMRDEFPKDDQRRQILDNQIAEAQTAAAAPQVTPDMIKGMVDRLADRLKQNPDDPAGWARLIRSYGVLGDRKAQAAALAEAKAQFAGNPEALKAVEAEAGGQ